MHRSWQPGRTAESLGLGGALPGAPPGGMQEPGGPCGVGPGRVWEPPRRADASRSPGWLAAGLLLALAVPSLAACRTSPNVAAYVGDEQVTVAELDPAVDERLGDPAIAAFAAANEDAYSRQVLGVLVEQEVHDAVAEQYGVAGERRRGPGPARPSWAARTRRQAYGEPRRPGHQPARTRSRSSASS